MQRAVSLARCLDDGRCAVHAIAAQRVPEQYDALREVKKDADKQLIAQSHKHAISHVGVRPVPG